MIKSEKKELTPQQLSSLLETLNARFKNNRRRHEDLEWDAIQEKLQANPNKLWSLNQMEETGGEPDVVGYNPQTKEYLFYDCAAESPIGRRSLCYDPKALDSRKEHKPKNSAVAMAASMGIELLNEVQYRELQQLGNFDSKTSSWLLTTDKIRSLGGALFGDFRYNTVFIYHNGAESYYAARGFRGALWV